MNRAALVLCLAVTLPACSLFGTQQPDVEIRERATRIVCDTTERPEPVNLGDTPPTLVWNDPEGEWGFWFSSELYAVLAENLQAMRRYMEQSRDISAKLRRCIDDHNARAAAGDDPGS